MTLSPANPLRARRIARATRARHVLHGGVTRQHAASPAAPRECAHLCTRNCGIWVVFPDPVSPSDAACDTSRHTRTRPAHVRNHPNQRPPTHTRIKTNPPSDPPKLSCNPPRHTTRTRTHTHTHTHKHTHTHTRTRPHTHANSHTHTHTQIIHKHTHTHTHTQTHKHSHVRTYNHHLTPPQVLLERVKEPPHRQPLARLQQLIIPAHPRAAHEVRPSYSACRWRRRQVENRALAYVGPRRHVRAQTRVKATHTGAPAQIRTSISAPHNTTHAANAHHPASGGPRNRPQPPAQCSTATTHSLTHFDVYGSDVSGFSRGTFASIVDAEPTPSTSSRARLRSDIAGRSIEQWGTFVGRQWHRTRDVRTLTCHSQL